ncbi:hypothetical protein NFI96_015984, partial [Prochilodus magdalenae]
VLQGGDNTQTTDNSGTPLREPFTFNDIPCIDDAEEGTAHGHLSVVCRQEEPAAHSVSQSFATLCVCACIMSLRGNSFTSLSMSGSSRVSVSATDSRESMRGLNVRLADYLAQVRELQEANSKLEAQIREKASSRSSEERDWTKYDKTIAHLREQLRELTVDNAQLMLQIDNARLAADDFKIKFEAEHAVRQGVDTDVVNLRKMIDDTHMNSMQLESEIESLKEELILLNRNHEEDVADLKGQITGSSVDVQMEARRGDDLSEIIDKIRQQYEKATQKRREETEAWYQAKFDNVTAEVSRSTETIQQGKSEVNDLRRQKQVLEIDVQALRSMNHSLEDNLRDTAGRYAQEMNYHNATIQELQAELGEVHAQVERQGAEYQALLNIKIKLEAEIATYEHLLEDTGVDDSIRDPGSRSDGNVRGPGAGTRDDVIFKGTGVRDDVNVKGTGVRDDVTFKGTGILDDVTIKGTDILDDVTIKGNDVLDDVTIKGTDIFDDVTIKGTDILDDVNSKDNGIGDDVNVKDNGAPEDANSLVRDTTVPEDDIVEFSLEQALNAAPPVPTPDQMISVEITDLLVVSPSDLKLNAANGSAAEAEQEDAKDRGEEGAVVLEEAPSIKSAVEDAGGDVETKREEVKLAAAKKEDGEEEVEVKAVVEEKQEEIQPDVEEKQEEAEREVKEKQEEVEREVKEKQEEAEREVKEKQEEAEPKVEEKQEKPVVEENEEEAEQEAEGKPAAEEKKEEAEQKTEDQKAEEKRDDTVGPDGELEGKPVLNEEEQEE